MGVAHRARSFVTARSTTQKVGGLAAVALLLTAPFGGLEAEPPPQPAALHLGQRLHLGPVDVVVQKVVSLPSLSPTITPEVKGDRLLVIEALVRNVTDQPQFSKQLADAFYGRRLGVPVPGVAPTGRTFLVADGSNTDEQLNPGLTYEVAVVFEQRGDWRPGVGARAPLLGLNGYVFRTDDPQTLDPDAWVLDRPLVAGPVNVEVRS